MRYSGFGFFLLVLSLFWCGLVSAIDLPKNPKLPNINQPQDKEKQKNLQAFQVEISFQGTETDFKGKMSIPAFKLTIVSEKNGFQFYKDLALNEIKSIRIKKWKGFAGKNSKDGRHNFYPIEYEIYDYKGTSFLYQRNIPQINEFIFETEYGTTKLFSYFVDYFNGSYWEMSKRKSKDLETAKALKKVVTQIEFIQASQADTHDKK